MEFLINLHIQDNLRFKEIGDKLFLDKLEVIDKNEETLLCLDSSGELDYYDYNGKCLSEDDKPNINTYESKYVLFDNCSLSDPLALQLEADLNSLCRDKIRKLMVCYDSVRPRLPEGISRDFKFTIIKNEYLKRYTLKITIPNANGSCLMGGHWTEDLSLPVDAGDSSRLILYWGEFSSVGSFDIYVEDPKEWKLETYNRGQI